MGSEEKWILEHVEETDIKKWLETQVRKGPGSLLWRRGKSGLWMKG